VAHLTGSAAATLAVALLTLSACADRGENSNRGLLERAGLSRGGPDEFLVIERRPLQTPPELSALPPPSPGTPSRVDPTPQDALAEILTGVRRPPLPRHQAPGSRRFLSGWAATAPQAGAIW